MLDSFKTQMPHYLQLFGQTLGWNVTLSPVYCYQWCVFVCAQRQQGRLRTWCGHQTEPMCVSTGSCMRYEYEKL